MTPACLANQIGDARVLKADTVEIDGETLHRIRCEETSYPPRFSRDGVGGTFTVYATTDGHAITPGIGEYGTGIRWWVEGPAILAWWNQQRSRGYYVLSSDRTWGAKNLREAVEKIRGARAESGLDIA